MAGIKLSNREILTMSSEISFENRLDKALNARGLSQKELSEALGLSSSAISQYLSGNKRPSRENIIEIARILDVPAGWLEFGEGPEPEFDLNHQREDYIVNTEWNFRPEPIDGGRDFGNANIWAIPWDINSLVREAIQNSLDAAINPQIGIDVEFSIIRLNGDELQNFLNAIKWKDTSDSIGLKSHIKATAKSEQKLGNLLKDGLDHFDDTQELILLRIDDYGARGLTGKEFGRSHFAALCRNNLDSQKASELSGGSFGLGKAVFWRASRFSTVFFNSNLEEPYKTDGKIQQHGRMIGKSDLAWHEVKDHQFSGPGWFGITEQSNGKSRPLSIWNNQALAKDTYLNRAKDDLGTSILVVGFYDSNSEDPDDVDRMADKIEEAVARNFWPSLVSGSVVVRVKIIENGTERRSMPVDAEKYEPELVDAYRKYQRGEVVDKLNEVGDVAQKFVQISIPRRTTKPKHDEVTHEAVLLVRLDSNDSSDKDLNRAYFFRGQEMIVMTKNWTNLVFGGAPYRAIVICGRAVGKTDSDLAAEQFFRATEPPAHNDWTMTSELRIEYVRGGKASLDRFIRSVRNEIKKLIKPKYENLTEGPDVLKKLLRITGSLPEPEARPKVFDDPSNSYVNKDGSWVVRGIVKVPEDHLWKMEPTLRFAAETGSGKNVKWQLKSIRGCKIKDSQLIIEPGIREAEFEGISDVNSHPSPSKDTAVKLLLRNVTKE